MEPRALTNEDRAQLAAALACRFCAEQFGVVYLLIHRRVCDLRDIFGYQMDEWQCPNCDRHVLIEVR